MKIISHCILIKITTLKLFKFSVVTTKYELKYYLLITHCLTLYPLIGNIVS